VGELGLHFDIATIPFLFKAFVFATFLLILAVIDIDHQLLPNRLTLSGAVIGLVLSPFMLPNRSDVFPGGGRLFNVAPALDGFLQSFLGMLVGGGIIFLIFLIGYLIYRFAAMGLGDVKLAGMIGAFVGLSSIGPSLFVGFVAGGIFGVIFMILKVAGLRSLIPFGPYLCLGGLVAFLWGPNIVHAYLAYLR
jgi:leader peptidase (prepilin peptidase)/N-methyltransferase